MLYGCILGSGLACGGNSEEPEMLTQEYSDCDEREEEAMAPLASNTEDLGSDEDNPSTGKTSVDLHVRGIPRLLYSSMCTS